MTILFFTLFAACPNANSERGGGLMVRVRRVNILLEGEYISSFSNCISLMIIQVCVCICSGTWHHESWCSTNGEGVSGHNDHHPRGEISLRLGDWGIHTSVTCALQLIQTRYIWIHISVSSTLQFIKKINSIDEEVRKLRQEANLDNVLYITKL